MSPILRTLLYAIVILVPGGLLLLPALVALHLRRRVNVTPEHQPASAK
jgi:hypothetical protein